MDHRWKMVVNTEGKPYLLFDLQADPDENHNLAGDPEMAGVRARAERPPLPAPHQRPAPLSLARPRRPGHRLQRSRRKPPVNRRPRGLWLRRKLDFTPPASNHPRPSPVGEEQPRMRSIRRALGGVVVGWPKARVRSNHSTKGNQMNYRRMGSSDLEVSAIGFGCWELGGTYGAIDETSAVAAIHRAMDLGVTLFDTAPGYGLGHSEQVLGRALGARRKDVVLVSKTAMSWDPITLTTQDGLALLHRQTDRRAEPGTPRHRPSRPAADPLARHRYALLKRRCAP